MKGKRLVLRADASAQIGTGHVMRCTALAHSWKERGGDVTFVTTCRNECLLRRLHDAADDVVPVAQPYPDSGDQEAILRVLESHPKAYVVLDGYHFDPGYQDRVRQTGHRLLVIDDVAHLERYNADFLLNQNIHAERLSYHCNSDAELLLGTRYALVRPEFLVWRDWRRGTVEVARRVLVTLGGSDPNNVTLKVVRALKQLDVRDIEVKTLVGPANLHLDSLSQAIKTSARTFQLLTYVNNMPELMARADLAVSAGGSTCWELAFMGLPNIILVLADNQRGIGEGLAAAGVAVNLGWHEKVSDDRIAETLRELMQDRARRETMSAHGRQLVDGFGAARVAAAMLGDVG